MPIGSPEHVTFTALLRQEYCLLRYRLQAGVQDSFLTFEVYKDEITMQLVDKACKILGMCHHASKMNHPGSSLRLQPRFWAPVLFGMSSLCCTFSAFTLNPPDSIAKTSKPFVFIKVSLFC